MPDEIQPPRERRTFWRFLVVGCINASIDGGVFLLLSLIGLPVLVANLISTTCGLIFSFFANRSFTFSARRTDRRSSVLQALLFVGVTGVGLWIIQPLVILGLQPLVADLEWLPEIASVALPKVAAIGVALVWNYVLFRFVVFTRR